MECVGMAESTDFSMVSFPAGDSCREDHEAALSLIRSTIEEKRSRFLLVKSFGRPKYFPTPPSFAIPRVCLTLMRISCGVLAEKDIEDLLVLISCSEASS